MGIVTPVTEGIVFSLIIFWPAFGLSMSYGITRFINFAYGDFFTIGAFVGFYATILMSNFIGALISAFIVTGLIGLVLARVIFKPMREKGPLVLLITSLGLGICIRHFIAMCRGTKPVFMSTPFSGDISLGVVSLQYYQIAIILVSVFFLATLYYLIHYTKWGARIRAVSSNRTLSRITGIKVERTISIVWFLGAGAAGVGGVLYALVSSINPMLGWHWMVIAFTAVLVGGIGSLKGAIGGSLIIGVGSHLATYYWSSGYSMAFVFGVLVLTLLLNPEGLAEGMIRGEI